MICSASSTALSAYPEQKKKLKDVNEQLAKLEPKVKQAKKIAKDEKDPEKKKPLSEAARKLVAAMGVLAFAAYGAYRLSDAPRPGPGGEAGLAEGTCPEAERACRESIAIPVYPRLPSTAIERVCEAIRGAVE